MTTRILCIEERVSEQEFEFLLKLADFHGCTLDSLLKHALNRGLHELELMYEEKEML